MSERIGTDTAEILPGSFGADLILGFGGNDRIDGNAGSDTLAGNAGIDTILGGSDNDFVLGGQDQDFLYGNEGNDTIFGNKGLDVIEGGSGDDVIFGGQGNDVILGGIGNDVIRGDLGSDTFIGGSGADVFVLTRKSGGATLEEADVIADFVPGIDSIGLADSIDTKSLNITFQSIANSSSNVNVVVQDLNTGQILAVVRNVRRSDFTSNDIFTTVLDPSSNVDPGEIPGSETDTIEGGGSDPSLPPPPVPPGKSAPLTTNTTIVAFQDSLYEFSSSDFSYFDIDGDPFAAVRITSLPEQGDLFLTSITKDATTGDSTITRKPVAVDAEISKASLSSLIFVPDPNTTGANYGSFTFRVSDGANLSNVGTASIIVKAKSSLPIGETNVGKPTIDAAEIAIAEEPENGNPKPVQLFITIKPFDDSGKLTKAVVSLSGGSPVTGEDILVVDLKKLDGLNAGISASLYDPVNRTLTLTGEASVDAYEKALKLIEYKNTVNSLPKDPRTVTVTIEDGLNPAVSASYTLKVEADDDLIEIKNADPSALTATESAAASGINPILLPIFSDAASGALTFVDPDNNGGAGSVNISKIQVSISGASVDDSLVSAGSSNISFTSGGGSTLTLTSNGSPTLTDYVNALKTIKFENDSDAPETATTRQIFIAINNQPPSFVRNLSVVAADDDVVEIKNAANSPLSVTESALASATNPATSDFIFADSGGTLTFVDPDSAAVISDLEVSISSGFQGGADSLAFSASTGINFSVSGQTLKLSPSGASATVQQYVDALKTIRFQNTSDTPDTSPRQISIAINNQSPSNVRAINVVATNDPPEMLVVTIPNYSVNTGTGTGSSLELPVANLLSQVTATDRDSDTLRLDITNVTNGGGGTWKYRNTSTSAFTSLTTGQVVENAGALRFDGATTEVATPSLSFKARDASASSTNNSTISVTLVSPFTDINSTTGPKQTHDASTGKTRIIFDALADALSGTSSAPDDITNFNPTEDVIRFRGTDFKSGDSMWSDKSVVSVSSGSTNVASTADIIFLDGSNDTAANTLASNNTLQASTIIVHRASSGTIRLYYVDDSGASPVTRQMATITLGAPATWTTFVSSGASAFEILAP